MSISVRARSPAGPLHDDAPRVVPIHGDGYPGSRADLTALLAVVAGLLALYLIPVFLTAARLPFGSDTAYYVWMSRLAEHVGLPATGFRAGSHALLIDVSRVSGLDLLQSIGPLDVALEVALGLAAAAVVCLATGFSRIRFVVVGVVASAYAARMATGYLANLLFMAVFLAALAALVADRRRSSLVLATAMFVAAGLAHGAFFGFSLAVVVGALVVRRLWPEPAAGAGSARSIDVGRLAWFAAGSVAVIGALLLTGRIAVSGSSTLHSGDAILRTLGMQDLLHAQYTQRFSGAISAAGLWATVPLAAWGLWFAARRGLGRLRLPGAVVFSWIAATATGIAVALAKGWFPAGRVLGVAIFLPLLAGIGVLGIAITLTRRAGALRAVLVAALTLVLLAAPIRSLLGSNVAASPAEIGATSATGHFADTLPPHTPLVFLAEVRGSSPAFEASRYENLTRMGLPADRVDDVYLFLGGPLDLSLGRPSLNGDPVHDSLALLYAKRVANVLDRPHAVFLLQPFSPHAWKKHVEGRLISPWARVLEAPLRHGAGNGGPSLRDLSPLGRMGGAIGFLVLLTLVGLGWVRSLLPRANATAVFALAPAVGAAALTLGSVAADAVGLRLEHAAIGVVALAGLLGYLAWWRSSRSHA